MARAVSVEAEPLGRALVQLTRRSAVRTDDPKALLQRVPAGGLVDMACHHRVPGVVFRALTELDVEDEGFAGLRVASQMASLAHGRCLMEVKGTAEVFSGLEQPWLVVKGPVLAELGYRDPGARLYEDLDLLVSPTDLPCSLELLEGAGARVTDLNWPMMARLRRAEIPMILPTGMLGDLHWDLLVTPNVRKRFRMPMEELIERRRVVSIGGMAVPTLDVVDGLLYLCLHGSLSGGHQLVWLKDLDQMIEHEPPEWDELVRRARAGGVDLVAAIQLERVRSVLGASIPEDVVTTLAGGRSWWRSWQQRERQVGTARWGDYHGTGRTFVSATSDSSLSSLTQLIRSMAADVVRPAVWELIKKGSRGRGDDRPPLHRPVGGPAERAEYLSRVRSGR